MSWSNVIASTNLASLVPYFVSRTASSGMRWSSCCRPARAISYRVDGSEPTYSTLGMVICTILSTILWSNWLMFRRQNVGLILHHYQYSVGAPPKSFTRFHPNWSIRDVTISIVWSTLLACINMNFSLNLTSGGVLRVLWAMVGASLCLNSAIPNHSLRLVSLI